MTTPYFQALDPQSPPDQITPAAGPSSPADYAGVTPHGQGPAPYNIQASLMDLSGPFQAAGVSAGDETSVYPSGPRQAASEAMLESPEGFGSDGYDIIDGFHGGGGDGWPADVEPDVAGP